MNFRDPRLWLTFVSAVIVFYMVIASLSRKSPGEITTVHSRQADLAKGQSCSSCHGGWFSSMADSCFECHKDIGQQIEQDSGLHGTLGKQKAQLCGYCHAEHNGSSFAMVNAQSFAAAGVPDRSKFDHNTIGYAMAGKHLQLQCNECHAHADTPVLPEGNKRFLGLDQDCAVCHEDSHKGRMTIGCAKCHGQEEFNKLHSEGHEKFSHLHGGHADVGCRICHEEGTDHSLERLGGRARKNIKQRLCGDCHENPHSEKFIAGVANQVAMKPAASCVVCHTEEHTSFVDKELKDTNIEVSHEHHAASGFPLNEPHDKAACEDCHAGSMGSSFTARYPGRGKDQCRKCHEDPHGGQFDNMAFKAKIFPGPGCVACHHRNQFEPHDFTPEKHALGSFQLTGTHLETDCHKCHLVKSDGKPREFRGTPNRCDKCHADAHYGYFDKVAAAPKPGGAAPKRRQRLRDRIRAEKYDPRVREQKRATEKGKCARCHLTTSFSELPKKGFDHKRWTNYEVLGAHAQMDCDACHIRSEKPDARGRTFGRIKNLFGKFKGCVTCHKDPHQGHFDSPKLPRVVNRKTGCARCHVETSFRTFPGGWDHEKWTGFVIDGAHETAGCAACHAPLAKPDEHGRTWARAKGRQCSNCHEDPHGGQFVKRGTTDCRRCHKSASSFLNLAFRHNLDSQFRLGPQHKRVACAKCHKKERIGGKELVRYRPLKRECADCHGSQDDPLRRRKAKSRGGRR